ncbi:MAG: N-6 DNA methylase [Ignavibacteriae bacterium]|nr:N-6 DNA methylase [Ignavibacteriota bacterium]
MNGYISNSHSGYNCLPFNIETSFRLFFIQHFPDLEHNVQHIVNAFTDIGYTRNLIKKDCEFTDFFSQNALLRKIHLGIYGQEPLNYRSACFGIHFSDNATDTESVAKNFRSFGATQYFIIINGQTERWVNAERAPVFIERFPTDNLVKLIKEHRKTWNPDALIRYKLGLGNLKPIPQQYDFIDLGLLQALEHEASGKIDTLIKRVLNIIVNHQKLSKTKIPDRGIFDLIFKLLTAKLLKDSKIVPNLDIDFSQPRETLKSVQDYYNDKFNTLSLNIPSSLLKDISTEIGDSFSFRNLSVDSLTYVYENTLVTSEARKELGIHSTPPYLADYILGQIPFEDIPRAKWNVGDIMCGHSIFLIAAMRRMRGLLPRDWSGKQRHKFFIEHLIGNDKDEFATQVARMCLTLADFPESNGWNIQCQDVFENNNLEKLVSNISILVGNPPFEVQKESGHNVPKPALLLRRVFPKLSKGSFIGLVLPRSFLDGSDYRKERESILNGFEIISITTLPDKIFKHADSETAVVVAKRTEKQRIITTVYREVRDQNRKDFEKNYQTTWEETVPSIYFTQQMKGQLVVPFLKEIWDNLQWLPTLSSIADIKIGVQYEPRIVDGKINNYIKQKPFENSSPAIVNVTNKFFQFFCQDTVYMATEKELRRYRALGAWELDWKKPKVVIPAGRMSRHAWRYAAIIDNESRIISRDFYAVWPKNDQINVEILAALLNSPLAQAFIYGFSSQRGIPKRAYSGIPIPQIHNIQLNTISSLVSEYINVPSDLINDAKDILLQIDAEVLKLYALPPRLERKLLDIFWGRQRPVPFEFKGYYPPEFKSWIPLHIYLSRQYQESTPKKIFERLPNIDKRLIKHLKTVDIEG